jgi:hypothetical protein
MRRKPARIPRAERWHGVDWFQPVPLAPRSKVLVHGVTRDAPRGLLAYWRRESERLHRESERSAA